MMGVNYEQILEMGPWSIEGIMGHFEIFLRQKWSWTTRINAYLDAKGLNCLN